MENILFLVVATVAGIAMAIQGSLNSVLGKIVGQLEATFIVHLVGSLLLAMLLLILKFDKINLSELASAPWYTYMGGVLNVIILYGVVFSIPYLGVANATTAIIVGQVLTAILIDHLGLWGLEKVPYQWSQLIGLGLLAAGAKLILNVE